ncbi:MAG: hypothetical protein QOI54_645 [Actinomycetota bacterium]|jgi:nucleotide-binding universal stress UspA family protein|nr:hypothetical protein [Actinomycetota bacterium]
MSASPEAGRARIVVGVDGSEASRAALRWAAEEASLRDAELQALLVWEPPLPWIYGPVGAAQIAYVGMAPLIDPAQVERRARETLAQAVAEAFGDQPPPDVEQEVIQGNPAAVLIAQATDASMLVLGTKGHGKLLGVDLGSTAEKCLRHASCNVIVIRPRKRG